MRRGGVSLDPLSHLAVRVLLCPHCAADIWCMQRNILISLFISLSALSSKREPCTLHATYTDSAARCRSSLYTSHPQRDTSHTRGTCESPTSSHYRSRVTTDRHRPANSRLYTDCACPAPYVPQCKTLVLWISPPDLTLNLILTQRYLITQLEFLIVALLTLHPTSLC